MWKSAQLFGEGLMRRFWALVPGGFLAALDLAQRETGKPIDVPGWVFWLLFGLAVLLAAFLTYHDLRIAQRGAASRAGSLDPRYEALGDLIGKSLQVGLSLSENGNWPLRNAWEAHARRLIVSAYGESEGMYVFTPELKGGKVEKGGSIALATMVQPPPNAELLNGMKALLGRLPTLTIRPDFDPSDWDVFDPAAYRAKAARPIQETADGQWTCPWCDWETEHSYAFECARCKAEKVPGLVYQRLDPQSIQA